MVGKLPMRLRLNRWSEPITVPILKVGRELYPSSWDIACLSDRDGTPKRRTRRSRMVRVSDRLLELGRIRISRAIQDEPDALKAALPKTLRGVPGGLAIARMGPSTF